jgi:predicted nucleic acid-binding protein
LFRSASELASASLAYIEARAALGRIEREGRVTRAGADRARADLEWIWSELHAISLDDSLVRRAASAAELLRLRAGDAIHVSSALAFDAPELVFATWDSDLRHGALEAGLMVAP